jgi:hypothetical protein
MAPFFTKKTQLILVIQYVKKIDKLLNIFYFPKKEGLIDEVKNIVWLRI